ncbi:hypothetical protein H5123_05460 [Shewanella sp. SR43-4]|uniref:hypothetical protein n=1 Tax=Shewanella sp. SR43-4 TaxID=2760942 RepID=UPI0015FD9CBB|nr:hypothetical protein [Shewanella sp. SR43-4]MBB1317084.1 hypothetical protein [Shewanella sp. SR43-4]
MMLIDIIWNNNNDVINATVSGLGAQSSIQTPKQLKDFIGAYSLMSWTSLIGLTKALEVSHIKAILPGPMAVLMANFTLDSKSSLQC